MKPKNLSQYAFRLRAPKGLDDTLLKEIKQLKLKNWTSIPEKLAGRKTIEMRGHMPLLW